MQYLKGDLGLLGAGHICSYKIKKTPENISTFKFKATYSSHPSQAAGTTKPLEFRPLQAHLIVFGADWLVKSLGQKTS